MEFAEKLGFEHHCLSCIYHPRVSLVLISRTNQKSSIEFRPEDISWRTHGRDLFQSRLRISTGSPNANQLFSKVCDFKYSANHSCSLSAFRNRQGSRFEADQSCIGSRYPACTK